MLTYKELEELLFNKNQQIDCQMDSKEVKPGSLFFALKGEKNDGHAFLEEVAQKGAWGAVVEELYKGPDFNLALYRVQDVLKELQKLAEEKLRREEGVIIGITGSCGKTTTKEFLSQILEGSFTVASSIKSFNSQRGLPISILNLPKNKEIIVLEMGMSLRGEMQILQKIVQPDIGIITKIALVHAGHFESEEEIAREKKEIFAKRTKLKIINHELLRFKLFKREEYITYSMKHKEADCYLEKKDNKIFIRGKHQAVFPIPFEETHFLENFLACYVAAKEIGIENRIVESQMQNLRSLPLRFEKEWINGVLYVKDCYNANMTSMQAALENLPKVKGKKIAVLGEMRELGSFSKMSHEYVGKIASDKIDCLICLGKECEHLIKSFAKEAFLAQSIEEIVAKLKEIVQKEDLVLVKGSRSLELERIFSLL